MNDNCYNCRDLQQQLNQLRAELESVKLENISLVTSTIKLRDEIQVLRKLMFPRQNSEYRYFIHPDAVSDYLRVIRGD